MAGNPPTSKFFEHLLIKCRLINSSKLHLFTHSTSLYKRVRKQLGWSKVIANIALNAYSEFLEMKLITKDFDTTNIIPSWCVREVWKTHALCDAKDYDEGCRGLCGRNIRYHVEIKPEQECEYNESQLYTESVYVARFNRHLPKPIWSFHFDPYWKNEYQTENDMKYAKKVKENKCIQVSSGGKKTYVKSMCKKETSHVKSFYNTTSSTSQPTSISLNHDVAGPSNDNNSNNVTPSTSKRSKRISGSKRPPPRNPVMTRSRAKVMKLDV